MWVFEPSVAEAIVQQMLREAKVTVVLKERLNRAKGLGVQLEGNRIASISMESGKQYAGSMFVDATYEGDRMASGGVIFTLGR